MATHIITSVHKELAPDSRHRHIAGVCTETGRYYRRLDVIDSIQAGDTWKVRVAGGEASIQVVSSCPHRHCLASPYIQTDPGSTANANLENLDECSSSAPPSGSRALPHVEDPASLGRIVAEPAGRNG